MVISINGGTIHWQAKQQPIVAKSTCEAEYIAAAEAATHTLWIRNLLRELGITLPPTPLHIDNSAAAHMARQQAPTKRRKCIDIKYHFLQDTIKQNAIKVVRVPTHDMPAVLMTKPLKRSTFQRHLRNLRIEAPSLSSTSQKQTRGRFEQTDPTL